MEDFMSDDHQMALSKFESMLQSNKVYFFDSEEFEEIVYFYMDSGKINLAKKAIALSLTQHPTSIPLKLIQVELLIFEKNFKTAGKLLQILENTDPTYDEIYIQKASILSKNNNHKEAVVELKKALKFTADVVDVRALLGMEYLFLEAFDLARENFEFCLHEDIEDYASLYNIIYCFDMLDKNEEAIAFLNAYIDKNPYCEVAWHQLGREYFDKKMYIEALRSYDYAILIDELFIGAYFEKARIYERLSRFEEAISNYMITLKLDDPTAFTYLQIGLCYEKIDDFKNAVRFYEKAIDEDPMLDKTWLFITNIYLDNKQPEKALHYIKKALEIDSDDYNFINRFAEINIRLNLFEEAALAFKKSLYLGDNRLELYIALVDVLHFIGDYNDACNVLIEANTMYNNIVEILYRLSGINYLLRNKMDMLLYFEQALKIDYSYHTNMKELYPTLFNDEQIIVLLKKFKS